MLIAQIVLAIVVFVYIGDLQEAVRPVMDNLWQRHAEEATAKIWDGIHVAVSKS